MLPRPDVRFYLVEIRVQFSVDIPDPLARFSPIPPPTIRPQEAPQMTQGRK